MNPGKEFRRVFGAEAGDSFAAESHAGAGPGDGAAGPARLDAAIGQMRLLMAGLTPAQAKKAEPEIQAIEDLAETFKQTNVLPTDDRAQVQLEALVKSDGTRPACLVRNGRLLAPEALGVLGELYRLDSLRFDEAFVATGRISDGRRFHGGGFLVRIQTEEGIEEGIVTARHVVQAISRDVDGLRLAPGAEIDFNGEIGSTVTNRHRLAEVIASGPESIGLSSAPDAWDFALVRLADPIEGGKRPPPAEISLQPRLIEDDASAGVLSFPGHPGLRPSEMMPGTIWHKLFQGLWNVKRFSPAKLMPRPTDGPYATLAPHMLLHDATTTGGSSGGALLAMASGQVAGVHVGGRSKTANLAISLRAIAARCSWTPAP